MKKFIIQFVLLIAVIVGAFFIYKGQSLNIPFLPQKTQVSKAIVGSIKINIEIADTQGKRSKGLGGRQSLASDSGMLFIFPKEDFYSFWMKGVKFPLDFIWIRGNKIIDITENVQAPIAGEKNENLPIYQSKESIDKLLEVNAGFVTRHGIKIGNTLNLQR